MRYLRSIIWLMMVAGTFLLASSQAQAVEETAVLTQKQIDQIIETCEETRFQLKELHASDALIRVNIGQEYANLSTRLMAPLNSRIALNGLDGVELSRATVDYNDALSEFQQRYQTYETSMSAAIKTDCQKQPVEYYSHIKNTRRLRAEVSESVQQMNKLIGDFQTSFETFAKDVLEEAD